MSPFLIHAFLLDRYGPRLDKRQIAELLRLSVGTVMNKSSAQTLGFPTYVDHGTLWADAGHLADYLHRLAVEAAAKHAERLG